MKSKKFPCPICKGQGEFLEDVVEGHRITTQCGYCEGEALIEINGKRHIELREQNIAIDALCKFSTQELWENDKIKELGEKIHQLVHDLELI